MLPGFTAPSSLGKTRGNYATASLMGSGFALALSVGDSAILSLSLPGFSGPSAPFAGGRSCGPCYLDNTGACVQDCLICSGPRPGSCQDVTLNCPDTACCPPGHDPCPDGKFCCPPGQPCSDSKSHLCCASGEQCWSLRQCLSGARALNPDLHPRRLRLHVRCGVRNVWRGLLPHSKHVLLQQRLHRHEDGSHELWGVQHAVEVHSVPAVGWQPPLEMLRFGLPGCEIRQKKLR